MPWDGHHILTVLADQMNVIPVSGQVIHRRTGAYVCVFNEPDFLQHRKSAVDSRTIHFLGPRLNLFEDRFLIRMGQVVNRSQNQLPLCGYSIPVLTEFLGPGIGRRIHQSAGSESAGLS